MTAAASDPDALGHELRIAIGRLARRLRQLYAAGEAAGDPSFLELAVLTRLGREGSASPGGLAGAEGVSAQAVGSVLASLARRGLVSRTRDPADGRRATIALTASGRRLLRARGQVVTERLVAAIADDLDADERRRLAAALPLLERLADRV
jgi:DNA-binding MarR family transcriptional regulator